MQHLDLTYLNWSKTKNSSGTAGSFLKAFYNNEYYKLSNYDQFKGIVGHESINEYVVSRLLDILDIEHVSYNLVNADIVIDNKALNTYVCISKDFKNSNESKTALDTYYAFYNNNDISPIQMLKDMGFSNYIDNIFLVDFLIINRDRHGGNIEIIRNQNTGELKLSPLFDHGLSLFFNTTDFNKLKNIDYLEDKRIQSFLGTNSLFENLKLMSNHPRIEKLTKKDKDYIFSDLYNVMPSIWIDSVYNLINSRIKYYENTFIKKQK